MHCDNYKKLSKEIRLAVKKVKEACVTQQCEQLEAEAMKGNSHGLFQAVRDITGRFQSHQLTIRDKHGNTLTDKDLVVNR